MRKDDHENVWSPGTHCFVVTDRKRRMASEYEIVRRDPDGLFFLKRVGSGNSYIRAREGRLFETKEAAIESLSS